MTLKIALLGVWHVHAKDHIASLLERRDRAEVVGVWDADPAAASAFAEEWGIKVIPDLDEALTADVDGVVVSSSTADHVTLIPRATGAGKHVFVEKVLAADLATADVIVEAAAANGVTITVGLQRLTESFAVTLREAVGRGLIGDVTSSRLRFSHGGAYATWLPERFFDPAQSQGGVLIDLAAHSLYLGMVFAGGVPQDVSALRGFVTHRQAEDNVAVLMAYPSGAIIVAESSFTAGFSSFQVEIVGTGGTLTVDSADLVVRRRQSEDSGWTVIPSLARGSEPIDQFLDAITTGRQQGESLQIARALTAVVEAAYRSAELRRVTHLPDSADLSI